MYSLRSTEPQLGQDHSRSDRTELCTAWAEQSRSSDRTITSVIVLFKLWFCTAQAVHSSVLSDLLLSCPSYGSVLLKLGQDNNRSERTELCTAWPVQNHSLDRTITDRTEQIYVQLEQYRAVARTELRFCPAQAVHSSVLSDLLLSCPSCGSVVLKLYIFLFCPICYCPVRATVQFEQYRTTAWARQ
jgi:hypothetical protein